MISIVKLALLALPVVLFLAAVLIATGNPGKKETRGKKVRWLPLVLALILAVGYTAGFLRLSGMQDELEGSMTISLNYAKASKGLYPNGTRFNTYDILSDEVLEKAIADGQLGDLTPRQLRAALSVEPLEAGSKISAERYYVSTEYVLNYSATGDTQHLNKTQVLEAVSNAYGDIFASQYSRKTNILQPDFTRLDALDYLDKVDLLEKYANDISDYLEMCAEESMTYTYTDGETFDSLQSKVMTLAEVELERLNAYILVKGLSSDVAQQVSKLNYQNLMNGIEADKNTKSYEIHLEAIAMYERDMATIVLIPTRDENGEFYMSRTNIGVDYFADSAEDYSVYATRAMTSTANNNYAIDRLSNSTAGEQDYLTADDLLESICTNLGAYAKKGLAMVESFDAQTTGETLTFGLEDGAQSVKSMAVKTAILMTMMGVSALFLLSVLPVRRSKKN